MSLYNFYLYLLRCNSKGTGYLKRQSAAKDNFGGMPKF